MPVTETPKPTIPPQPQPSAPPKPTFAASPWSTTEADDLEHPPPPRR
jgi:hypothetical protein